MVEQKTLHNVLTCVIAVVIFIFQSLNYLIARIKNYVKHGENIATTVVTADTTVSSDSQLNDNNALEDFIRVQELIQKHFDIPLIVAEDEPNVNDLIESSSPSTNVCKEKHESDQYVDRFIDDSYVARGLGLIAAIVGRQTDFYLYSKHDNDFENIVIEVKGRNGEVGKITIFDRNPVRSIALKSIPIDCNYDEDRIKVTYTPCAEGVHTLTLLRYGSPICRSPYYVSVEKSPTNSRSRIRLGTKKYKMVTKFGKGKCTPIETKDNSSTSPTVEFSSNPTVKSPTRPVSEESGIKTDVMSIVTKFESKSMNIKKRPQKRMTSISEKSSEYDIINTNTTICLEPKIEPSGKTNNADHNVSNIRKINSNVEIDNGNNFSDEVDNQNKENESSYKNGNNIDENQNNTPIVIPNEHIESASESLARENTSPSEQEPAEETLKNNNFFKVEEQNQTSEIDKLLEERKNNECLTDTVVDLSETDFADVEPCGTPNKTSYFDDGYRKTVVVVENANELESRPNDFTTLSTTTDSRQYDIIQPPLTSIITKITESVCETCSKQVFRILSEFPRDINITHNKSTNEVRSTFETLLTQPIRININIDNVIENATSATQEHKNTRMPTDHSTNLEHVDTAVECHSPKEINFMGDHSEVLQCDINRVNTELKVERNNNGSEISMEENKTDTNAIPLAEKSMETAGVHQQQIISSTDQIIIHKCSKNEEHDVSTISCNLFNGIVVHNSEDKKESHDLNEQISAIEQHVDSNEPNQINELIIDEVLDHTSEVSVSAPDENSLLVTKNDVNPKTTLDVNESRLIKNIAVSNENLEFESGIVENTIHTKEDSDNVSLDEEVCNELYCEQETSNAYGADNQNSIPTTIQNENQKLMMEKLIEPILNNYFKKNMVRRVLQFCLKTDESNINDTQIFENDNTNQFNELRKTELDNATGKTDTNIENKDQKIENSDTSKMKETNYDDKSEHLEHEYLDDEKIDSHKLVNFIEQIIKTNIILNKNNEEIIAKTKIHNILLTAMNCSSSLQKNISNNDDNQGKSSYTQAIITDASVPNKVHSSEADEFKHEDLEKSDNEQIMGNIETSLVKISSEERIETTNEQKININDETVMINVSKFEGIETKGKIQLSSDTENLMMKDTMAYASIDTTFNTPIFNSSETSIVEECNCTEMQVLTNIQKSNNEETSTKELDIATETLPSNDSMVASINNKSSQESETINKIEVTDETETGDTEKQNNEGNQELSAPATVENIIIKSETIETEIINGTKEDLNTGEIEITGNTLNESLPPLLNNSNILSDEHQSTSSIVTSLNKNKMDVAKSFTVERETRIKLPLHNVREIIIVEIPDSKDKGTTDDTLVLHGISTIRIEIDTSDPQKSNATIVLSINDSKIVLQENISNVTIPDEIKTTQESNSVKTKNVLNDDLNERKIFIKSITENELTKNVDNVCIEEILKETEPIKDPTLSEIEMKKYQLLTEEIKDTIRESGHFNSTNTPAITIAKSVKDEVETSTSKLTASKQVVTTDTTIDLQTEDIVKHFDTTDYEILPIEESVNDVETSNTIKKDINLQLLLAKDSPEEEKIVLEKLTSIYSPIISDEVAVKEEMKNLPANSVPDNLSPIPVKEPMEKTTEHSTVTVPKTDSFDIPIEESVKEVKTLTIKSINIDLQVLSAEYSPEVEKEIVSEEIPQIDYSASPDEKTVKEEMENLPADSVPDNSSVISIEEPIEKTTENSTVTVPITDSFALPIEESAKEVETFTTKSLNIDPQDLPSNDSPEVEKEIVSEKLPQIDSSTTSEEKTVKEEMENLPANSVLDNSSLIPVKEPIYKITENSTITVAKTDSFALQIEESVKEIETFTTKSLNIDPQDLPSNDSPEVEKEIVSEELPQIDYSASPDEKIVKEEMENLPADSVPDNSSVLSIEEPIEKTTENSTVTVPITDSFTLPIEETVKKVETLTIKSIDTDLQVLSTIYSPEVEKEMVSETTIDSSFIPDEEAVKKEMEILFKIPAEIVSVVQQAEESLEVEENNVITSNNILTANEPSIIIMKNISAPFTLTKTPDIPVEDTFEKEIQSSLSITNYAKHLLSEKKIEVENKNKISDLTTSDTSMKPIECPANEKIESTCMTLSENNSVVLLKYSVLDETVTVCDADISVVQKSAVTEVLNRNINTNNIPILPIEELVEKEIETIITKPDLVHCSPTFTEESIEVMKERIPESLNETDIETLNIIPTEIIAQVRELENSIEINDNNISEHSNTFDTSVITIENQIKEYTDISTGIPASVEESIEDCKKKEIECLTLMDISAILKKGPVIEKVVSPTTVQSNRETLVLPTNDSSEVEKEIVSENISSIELPTMPIREKIDKLPTKPALVDFLILPAEERIETVIEKHDGLNTSDTPIVLVEEPLKEGIGNSTTIPTEIISIVVLANELLEIVKKNEPDYLNTTDKSHIPVEEPVEVKTDFLVNPFLIGPLSAKVQESIYEETENISTYLIKSEKGKIFIEKSSSHDSLKLPLEEISEIEKQNTLDILTSTDTLATPNEEQVKLEVEILTSKPTENGVQTLPAEESLKVEINYEPKHFSLSDTSVISTKESEKEEIETPTTEPASTDSLFIPIKEPETEEIETTITESALEYSSISPIEEPIEIVKGNEPHNLTIMDIKQVEEFVKMEIESSTKLPIDFDSKILLEKDSAEVEKEKISEQLIPTNSLTTPDEEAVKEKTEFLPTKTVPKNTTLISVESIEKRQENQHENLIEINTTPIQIEELGVLEMETVSINQTEIFSQILAANKSIKVEERNIIEYSNTTDKSVILNEELVKEEAESVIRAITDNDSHKVLINESSKVEKEVVSEDKTKFDNIPPTPVEKTAKEIIETIPTNTVEITMEQLKANLHDNLTSTDTPEIQIEERKKVKEDTAILTEIISRIIPPERSEQVENNNTTKSLAVANAANVSIKDPTNEEIETLQSKPTLNNFPLVPVVKTMETIKENNIYNILRAEETVKIELETFTTTLSETISQVHPAEDLVKEEAKNIPKRANRTDESIGPIEELLIENIEFITKESTESDSQYIPIEESSELENKSNLENLTTNNALSVDEPVKVEIETLTTSLSDSQYVPTKLSLDDKIESICENVSATDNHTIPVEKQENNEVVTIPPKSNTSDSFEVLVEEKSRVEEETTSEKLIKYHIPTVTSELINGDEIKTLNRSGNLNNTVENIVHNEISLLVANNTHTVPIEESAEVKKSKISKTIIACDTLASPIKNSSNDNGDTSTVSLTKSELKVEPFEDTSRMKEETIPKDLKSNEIPTVPTEKKMKVEKGNADIAVTSTITIEEPVKQPENISSAIPTTLNNSVITVSEEKKEVLSENVFLTAPVEQSFETGKDTVPENIISIETLNKVMELKLQYVNENLNSNEISAQPTEESLDIDKEIIHGDFISNETPAATVEEKLVIKNESILSEHLISSDTIPVENLIKDKIETLSTTSISSNSSPAQLEEPMIIGKENVQSILLTSEIIILPNEEPVKEVQTLKKDIDSQVLLKNDLPEVENEIVSENLPPNDSSTIPDEKAVEKEIVSENLPPIDSSTTPDKNSLKEEMENLPANSVPDNSSVIPEEEPIEITTENSTLTVPITDSFALPIEESVKEVETLTVKSIESDLQVLPTKDSPEIKKEMVYEKFTLTDSSTIPHEEVVREQMENQPNNQTPDISLPIPVEEPKEEITDNPLASLITADTPTQIEELMKEKMEYTTSTTTEFFSRVVQLENQVRREKDNLVECFTIADTDIPPKESNTEEIEQPYKEIVGTSSIMGALDDSLPTPLEEIPEEKKDTFSKKCTSPDTSTLIVKEPLNNEVESLLTYIVTMDLPVTGDIETVSEPIKFELESTSDYPSVKKKKVLVSDELKRTKPFISIKTLLSDTTKSLSIKHSSDDSADVQSEDENITVDDFDVESTDNSKNDLLCGQNDITFEPSYNVITPNDEENKLNDESDNKVTTCSKDETVINEEETNYNYQTASSVNDEDETGNSDDVPNTNLDFGETSTTLHSDAESGLKEKLSFGIQKLEMSVHRVQTSDDDYLEKTFVQLEQTEKISMGENITEDENRTTSGDKLYTVNESDLNAILCASSLQEALTLLDSKIKFKFKHGTKTCGKKNSAMHKSNKTQTSSSSSSSGKNANFSEAREYFKTIEKKSKK